MTSSISPASSTTSALKASFKPDFLPQSQGPQDQNETDTTSDGGGPMEIDTYDDNASVVAETVPNRTPTANSSSSAANNASFLATVRANNVSKKGRKNTDDGNNNSNQRNQTSSLSRLLKEVKSELRIDGTRLRSGEYPFPNKVTSRFDLYDPRNRATCYLDVTLLGESWVPWNTTAPVRGRQATPSNMTILGYIHNHHRYPERDPCTPTSAEQHPAVAANNTLAWICFSSDTVQEHNLLKSSPRGYQLRIYNAIVTAIVEGEENVQVSDNCRYSVLCTQLCEPYPANILGPLQPTVGQLVAPFAA